MAYNTVNATGTIVPDTSDLQDTVDNEFKTAFGTDVPVTPNTPQGVLITAEVLARANVLQNNSTLANQINPNLAGGVFLDAIWALTGGARLVQTYSQVSANLAGVIGTIIPTSATAMTPDGVLWSPIAAITLVDNGSGGGIATGTFQAALPGAISAAPSTLTTIVNGVLGWETITNPAASTIGSSTQSDQAARKSRNNTLALQGTALPEAIRSALYNLGDPLVSMGFYENVTNAPLNTPDGAITLVPHSIYVCVGETNAVSLPGGVTNDQIANTLLSKKSAGAAWNGSTTVNVTDPVSGQVYPVKFDRPTAVPIAVQVTISANSVISDPVTAIKNAIVNYANGGVPGLVGFTVNTPVSAFELAYVIGQAFPSIFIQNLLTSYLAPPSFGTALLAININQIATILASNISVTIA